MERLTAQRILDIQEKICADQVLMVEYRTAQTAFLEMLPHLPQAQQDIIMNYLGVCVELHLRMLENALEAK